MTGYAVIVDPLSTGQEYGPAFRASGVAPVAVLTGAERGSLHGSWHPDNFDVVFHVDDYSDLGELGAQLRRLAPVCIVPGAEDGVEIFEALADLVLPGTTNVPHLASARRDKWAMARAMRAAGVPTRTPPWS